MRIRTAEERDIPALESVIDQHWKSNTNHAQELKNPKSVLLVAETDDDEGPQPIITGTALMWITEWNRTAYLAELAVARDYQRKGCGSKLVDELARRAKEKELRAIIVETQLDNKIAMDFYLKRRLRICGYNDRYYTNLPASGHDIAIFLSLDL